ncbi:MAG: phosphonate C-P lyase system protein PhnH [Gracilibacteraceae bacterium]|nr:phosphonate C-P lyase system protein PhnH [Gracilibacteraceae bacterium]
MPLTKKHAFDMVFDSQRVFRLLLEAMSRPGNIVDIGEYAGRLAGEEPAFLAVAATLLDNEVSFNAGADRVLADEIAALTLARREELGAADFVFTRGEDDMRPVIEKVKCGTPADPHKSATVVVLTGAPEGTLTLRGPGIDDRRTVLAARAVGEAIELRDAQNYEYPQGIDLIFISRGGKLLAVPRLVKVVE